VNLNFGILSPMFVLSPINNGAVLFQNMTRSFSRNNLAEQSQQHFMALDNFMLLRVFLEHSRTAETSAQKCSKPDNFNLKMSKIFRGGEQPLPRPHPPRSRRPFDLRHAPLRIPTSIFSNTPLPCTTRFCSI